MDHSELRRSSESVTAEEILDHSRHQQILKRSLTYELFSFTNFIKYFRNICRSQWTRRLRRGPTTACILGLWFRILPWAWLSLSCECSALPGRSRADHSSRGVLSSTVSECDREVSIMRRSWPTEGCWAVRKNELRYVINPSDSRNT
jgi:hypothetical protein